MFLKTYDGKVIVQLKNEEVLLNADGCIIKKFNGAPEIKKHMKNSLIADNGYNFIITPLNFFVISPDLKTSEPFAKYPSITVSAFCKLSNGRGFALIDSEGIKKIEVNHANKIILKEDRDFHPLILNNNHLPRVIGLINIKEDIFIVFSIFSSEYGSESICVYEYNFKNSTIQIIKNLDFGENSDLSSFLKVKFVDEFVFLKLDNSLKIFDIKKIYSKDYDMKILQLPSINYISGSKFQVFKINKDDFVTLNSNVLTYFNKNGSILNLKHLPIISEEIYNYEILPNKKHLVIVMTSEEIIVVDL